MNTGAGINQKNKKIMAVASQGGHWIQLLRLLPAFNKHDIHFISTDRARKLDVGGAPFYSVMEASLWNKCKLVIQAMQVFVLLLWVRPDVVISTGAAPGYFAVKFAHWLNIRTIWVDSIANVDKLSKSGKHALKFVDTFYTQWPHLQSDRVLYRGNVLGEESDSQKIIAA